MATGVGLRIAEDECIAAIVNGGGDSDAASEPLYITRESVLHMSDDGDAALGGEAPPGHAHSIRGFVSAIGDPAGISVDAGEAYRAEDLLATAVFCLINLAADHLSGPAEFYATHPADWPAEYIRGLREALDYLGLRSVLLVSEGELAAGEDEDGRGIAGNAARAALATVLSTPAGTTPPDPADAEYALVTTDVLPAVPAAATPMEAYSAAIPVPPATAEPEATVAATKAVPVESPAPEAATEDPRNRRRTPWLIAAAAAAIGLLLGGITAAMLLRDDAATQVPPSVTATPAQPVATTAGPPPPEPTATIAPQQAPQEYTEEPTTTTPSPTTTTVPPTTTTPSPTTTSPRPTRTTTPTTTPNRYPYSCTYQYPCTNPDGNPYTDFPGFPWQSPAPDPWGSSR